MITQPKTYFRRFIGYFLDPLYHYLNLYQDGAPSMSRVMLVGGFAHALVTLSYITFRMFEILPTENIRPKLSIAYLTFAALVYSLIFGYRGFHAWLNTKKLNDQLIAEVNGLPEVLKVEGDTVVRLMGAQKAPTHEED